MNKRLYTIFNNMKQRCYNPNNPDFRRYGGKSIDICEEWLKSFATFEEWALSNNYTDEMTIDRVKGNKGYSPENCQWLTKEENSAKKRRKYNTNNEVFVDTDEWRKKRLVIDRRKRSPNQKRCQKRTSMKDIRLEIEDQLHKKVKAVSALKGISMKQLVVNYFEKITNTRSVHPADYDYDMDKIMKALED